MKNLILSFFLLFTITLSAQYSKILEKSDDINCERMVYNTRELMQFAYNSHCKAEAYPFLSKNGQELYFTADHSYHWLFYTRKDSLTEVWSVPVPISVANYSGPILSTYFSPDLNELFFTNNASEVFHCKRSEGSKIDFGQVVQLSFITQSNSGSEEDLLRPFSSLSFLDNFNKMYAVTLKGTYAYYLKTAENTYTYQTGLSTFSEEIGFISTDGLSYYFTNDDVKNVLFCRTRASVNEDFNQEVFYIKKFEAHLKITQCRMSEDAKQLVLVLNDESWDRNDIYFYSLGKADTLKKFDLKTLVIRDVIERKDHPTPLFVTASSKPDLKNIKTVELLNQAGADICKIDIGIPFPNPCKSQFTIYFSVQGENPNSAMPILHITDLSGKVLYSQRLENNSGQVLVAPEHLNSGNYLIKIEYNGIFSNSVKLTYTLS